MKAKTKIVGILLMILSLTSCSTEKPAENRLKTSPKLTVKKKRISSSMGDPFLYLYDRV